MRSPRKLIRTLSALALAVALGGGAACGEVRPAAATIDGRAIPRESFLRELTALRNNKELARVAGGEAALGGNGRTGTFDARLAARWLDRLVVQEVIDREFDRRHLKISPADRAGAEAALSDQFGDAKVVAAFPAWFRERLVRRAQRQAVLEATLSGPPVNDQTAKAFYDRNANLFARTCLSHILVKTKKEATALAAEIGGGGDFAALARDKSIDTGSGAQGGSLGCTDLTKFVKEFGDAAAKLPVNQLSAPVKSQFGWHVIIVTSRDPAPDFESVKSTVTDTMTQRTRGQFAAVIGERLQKAKVKVDPRFGTYRFDPNNGPTIDPPEAPNPAESPTTQPAGPPGGAQIPGGAPPQSPSP